MKLAILVRTTVLATVPSLAVVYSFAQASSPAPEPSGGGAQTLTGIVSDSMCAAKHMAKDKSPAECTRMCVQQGTKYALFAGKKVYTLEGHESDLDKLAGQRVTAKGAVSGETVKVSSVARIVFRKSWNAPAKRAWPFMWSECSTGSWWNSRGSEKTLSRVY